MLSFNSYGDSKASIQKAIADAYDSKDYELAIKLSLPLAEAGDIGYQVMLYTLYVFNDNQIEEACKWVKKAAEQDDAFAHSLLGDCYLRGQGFLQDYKKAFYWLEKGAKLGSSQSQKWLAGMYMRGEGVLKDYKKALLWHSKAAEQNDFESMMVVGEMYCKGQGGQKNLVKSKYWMSKAYDEVSKYQLPDWKEHIKAIWEECDLANY
jgi:uncharacterized protein